MKLVSIVLVALLVGLATAAHAQLGRPNNPAQSPQMVPPLIPNPNAKLPTDPKFLPNPLATRPGFAVDPNMAPGSDPRASIPFGSDPNALNRPFPTTPNAGISGTGGYGVPIRHIWVAPQAVPIVVYDAHREGTGEQWNTQYTELPGYYVTETTLGYVYPERWALYTPAKGVYQWQRVPSVFQPK